MSQNNTKDPEKAMEVNDHDSDVEEVDEEGEAGVRSAQLLKNPAVLAALQGKLDSMVGNPSGYIQVRGKNHSWKKNTFTNAG